ncbi:MAG: YicC family protein [Candidatus Rokubacteria bacterium RIFCSPLOWO2_02_FULL_72_37]|nr:MAG: YicC family protein [Candidatus Rokubacteria bacterium RIFCSPLOWO2_02_FULL_72_37]
MASTRTAPAPRLSSMTGFGRGDAAGQGVSLTVEARSVNHRHLDVALRLPRALAALEPEARRLIQSRLERGRVDVAVQIAPGPGQAVQRVRADAPLAAEYVARARELGREVGVPGDVTLAWVLERAGVLRAEEAEAPAEATCEPVLVEALGRALDELVARRRTEGEALGVELRKLGADLGAQVDLIEARAPAAVARREERLRERIRTLLGVATVDEGRILTEVAIWADKTDVREELTRLRAHLTQVAQVLDAGGQVGRALDFLVQELHREVNTIASKADDLELSQAALAAKGVIEKMREQVQNLE